MFCLFIVYRHLMETFSVLLVTFLMKIDTLQQVITTVNIIKEKMHSKSILKRNKEFIIVFSSAFFVFEKFYQIYQFETHVKIVITLKSTKRQKTCWQAIHFIWRCWSRIIWQIVVNPFANTTEEISITQEQRLKSIWHLILF